MPRPLSPNSRKVLRQLGGAGKSIDELAARTKIDKDHIAKALWRLRELGWVSVKEEVRKVSVFVRARSVPRVKQAAEKKRQGLPEHLAALQAAFGIGLPRKRPRARTVRRAE